MAGVRHMLSALLAMIAMLSMGVATSGSEACPVEPAHAMAMHHRQHSQPLPDERALYACPACQAVLPPLAEPEADQLLPLAPVAATFQPLSGIDPALDPPPPRRA